MLQELFDRHKTDKGSVHSYAATYEMLWNEKRHDTSSILEIGIWRGGSLRAWLEYFPNAEVFGIDSSPGAVEAASHIEGVTPILCDVKNAERLAALLGKRKFDVVIDDASHKREDVIAAIEFFMPRLMPGGMLVIEDVQSIEFAAELQEKYGGTVADLRGQKGRYDDIIFYCEVPTLKIAKSAKPKKAKAKS
ncbi:MAG: class I SAM-dependent methyltransferase [Victivallaceae bacterium]